jgi:hypothetical protein
MILLGSLLLDVIAAPVRAPRKESWSSAEGLPMTMEFLK